MKIINILFNYKKSAHENKVLGVERCFIDYAKHLTAAGNEVVSVAKKGMIYSEELKRAGSKSLELSAFGQGDIFAIFRLALLFFTFKADVIICHSGRAMFFARAARFLLGKKTPIVAIDHGINPTKFLKADYVLTVNSYFSQQLVKAGKAPERALVIPNMMGIPQNFTQLVKQPFRKTVRIGALGRIYSEKFFDKILHAMVILRNRGLECEYVLGGVGPMESSLNQLAKDLGLENNFKILGWVDDKRKFFESIDIFILPSQQETFGIVLLEGMLYSTPIITSNSWGPDEIIDEGINGLKVSKDDEEKMPELLANAIEKLNNNQDFAKELAANAYQKFMDNYSSEMVAKKLNKILADVVRNG